MKNIPFFSILFFLNPFILLSQTDLPIEGKDLLQKNKDIIWIGETEFTYFFENYDRLNFQPGNNQQEDTRMIKIDPIATCNFDHERFFTYYIISLAKEGKLSLFSDTDKPLSGRDVEQLLASSSLDTIITYDPETYKEQFTIVQTDKIFDINSFKVRQWWFYNEEEKSLQSLVKAIGPVFKSVNEKRNPENGNALFWIEMEQLPGQVLDYNDQNVIWAKETVNSLSFEETKKIKGNTKKTLKNLTFKDPKNGKSITLENESWYPYCANPIDQESVNNLLAASRDTIITYHPETYKEEISIVKNPKIDFNDFDYFRVLQHWYFDQTTNQLSSKVFSIGPLINLYDENGDLKYRRALYYISSK